MLMAVIAWVSAAPDANAWTAEELCTTFDYGIEQWDGSANQNCWVVNGRKVEINYGYLNNGTEVFIVKNFLGAFDMYFTVSDNTVKGYNITNRNWYPTADVNYVKIGNYNVYSITIDRIVRADFNEHYKGNKFLGYEIT